MKAQNNSSGHSIAVHRVIPSSVIRRFRSDVARQKKAKQTLRRMKKEYGDE